MRDFKRIKAWQRAHALKDTIAEGAGAATNKEFARYLETPDDE